jgi:hypothetical protein
VSHRVGGKGMQTAADHMSQVDQALKLFYKEHPRGLALSMFWHTVGMACGIVQSWYFLLLLTDDPSFIMAAGIWFLGSWLDLLSFAVPFNIGVLEGTRVIVFNVLGFHSALGLTFGVALRLEQLFWAGVGLLFYGGLLVKRKEKGVYSREGVANGKI